MNEEIMNQLMENFPVLKKFDRDDLYLDINDKNQLQLVIDHCSMYELTQQDCLELSQLFALLATAFEEE